MALSPSHKFGQIIGIILERAVQDVLHGFALKHSLYLDRKGDRSCRTGQKCTWIDHNDNAHDLDFVLERGGTENNVGVPVAFIETAWRRYTKHSRAKAQEIQGAIEPLFETYRASGPLKGAVLAGEFTKGALKQLQSLSFKVLYFEPKSVFAAFDQVGIDARYDESTSHKVIDAKIQQVTAIGASGIAEIAAGFVKLHRAQFNDFLEALSVVMMRQVARVIIIALHGDHFEAGTIQEALTYVDGYVDDGRQKTLHRFEIEVRYNNQDTIKGNFGDKETGAAFLRTFQPATPRVV